VAPSQIPEAYRQRERDQNQKDFSRTALPFFLIIEKIVEIA
jgi:hypothetical protein